MITFINASLVWLSFVIIGVGCVFMVAAAVRSWRPLRTFPLLREAMVSPPMFFTKAVLFLSACVLVFLAALGPQEKVLVREPVREGMSVVASLDCSLSMLARMGEADARTRLSVVLESVHAVFRTLSDDKKGAVCFSGNMLGSTSLTTDYGRILKQQLEKINEHLIATHGSGTSFSAALEGCLELFDLEEPRRKVCIILSDGEPQGDEQYLQRELQKKINEVRVLTAQQGADIKFYLVGVGDPSRAYKIPRKDIRGNFAGFVCCDEHGDVIETRPSPVYLENIARTIGGTFVHISDASDLVEVVDDIIVAERKIVSYKTTTKKKDKTPPFFVSALLCGILWLFLPKRFFFWRLRKAREGNKE